MGPRLLTAVCVLLAAAACLAGLDVHPLMEPLEARHAEIAREMAQGGDWITPRLDGIRTFGEAPLYAHLAALAMRALGPVEAAARLPGAVAALASALIALWLGRRAFGPRTGAVAALLCATTPAVAILARTAGPEALLTACTSGALAGAWLAASGRARAGALVFWGALGLALLAGGPLGAALPVAGVGAYALLLRERALARALLWPAGPALAVATAAPWVVAMERANPGWLRACVTGGASAAAAGATAGVTPGATDGAGAMIAWWAPLALLPALCLPWTLAWPRAALRLRDAARRVRAGARASVLAGKSSGAAGTGTGAGAGAGPGAGRPPAPATEADRARVFLAASAYAPLGVVVVACALRAGQFGAPGGGALPGALSLLLPLVPPLALLAADAFAREAERRAPSPAIPRGEARGAPPPAAEAAPGDRTGAAREAGGQPPASGPAPGLAPGPAPALTLGDASSELARPAARSARVGPVDPPRPMATAYHVLALVLAIAAAVCGFAFVAPDVAHEQAPSWAPLDAAAPLLGALLGALALAAVGASATAIAEAKGLREAAPLALGGALAVALAGAPWVIERVVAATSTRALAAAASAAAGPDDEVLHHGPLIPGALFYMQRPAWVFRASPAVHGRRTSPDEVAARDLEGQADRLEVAWRGERRWVAICGSEADLAELTRIVGERRVTVLARVGGRVIVESRPRR